MMDLARARQIVIAICNRSFVTMGFQQDLESLDGISLAEMLEAARMVENANTAARAVSALTGEGHTSHVVPADRLIAAVYAFENYEPSRAPILALPHWSGKLRVIAVATLEVPANENAEQENA
jgi:hypothetical protein